MQHAHATNAALLGRHCDMRPAVTVEPEHQRRVAQKSNSAEYGGVGNSRLSKNATNACDVGKLDVIGYARVADVTTAHYPRPIARLPPRAQRARDLDPFLLGRKLFGIYIVYSLLIYKAYFPHKIILDSLAQIAHYSLAR